MSGNEFLKRRGMSENEFLEEKRYVQKGVFEEKRCVRKGGTMWDYGLTGLKRWIFRSSSALGNGSEEVEVSTFSDLWNIVWQGEA